MNDFKAERSGETKVEKVILKKIVRLALEEDRVFGDVTTNALRRYDRKVKAVVQAKETGIVSGISACRETFRAVDPGIRLEVLKTDGDGVKNRDQIILITGRESAILRAERTALNFLQRLSGVATTTRKFVEKTRSTGVSILDTRKTTPGMRYLEKKAVRHGGAENHRLNLEEMALIKDNHIRMAGSITRAVKAVRKKYPDKTIEVEVKDIAELKEALGLNVDIIMLDNFPTALIRQAVELKRPGVRFEVSGNITLNNILDRIIDGVDFVSVGALTHSFKSLDISLEILENKTGKGETHG